MSKRETDKQYIERIGERFPCIVAHGKAMGSYAYYIAGQLTEAVHDNAPSNAIRKNEDGTWDTK